MSTAMHMPERMARRWVRWVWLVLCVATLVPGVSRWLMHERGTMPWQMVEVCSTSGAHWVLQPENGSRRDALRRGHPLSRFLDACDLCTLAAERFAPLVPAWLAASPEHLPFALPLLPPWAGNAFQLIDSPARGPPSCPESR
jgi:hypothetical protein